HHIPDGRQLVVRVEAGRGGCRSVGEQSDRRVSADVAVCRGQREWVDRKDDLAAHSERNTTRGENRHVFGRGDDPLSHGRDGLLHVLTVVENEQALLLAQGFDEGSGRVSAWRRGSSHTASVWSGTRSGLLRPASSTIQAPFRNRSIDDDAASIASPVFPIPGGPNSVIG